jgi:hypothetical protein
MITAPGWDDSLVFASNQQLVQQQDHPTDVREQFLQNFLDFIRSFRKNGSFIYRYSNFWHYCKRVIILRQLRNLLFFLQEISFVAITR